MAVDVVVSGTEEMILVAGVDIRASTAGRVEVGSGEETVDVVEFGRNVMVTMLFVLTSACCVLVGESVVVVVVDGDGCSLVVDSASGVTDEVLTDSSSATGVVSVVDERGGGEVDTITSSAIITPSAGGRVVGTSLGETSETGVDDGETAVLASGGPALGARISAGAVTFSPSSAAMDEVSGLGSSFELTEEVSSRTSAGTSFDVVGSESAGC